MLVLFGFVSLFSPQLELDSRYQLWCVLAPGLTLLLILETEAERSWVPDGVGVKLTKQRMKTAQFVSSTGQRTDLFMDLFYDDLSSQKDQKEPI